MNYADYLKVEALLGLQAPASAAYGPGAHDEMLFIIVHQTYELWFKQILTELDLVQAIFDDPVMDEAHLARALAALERIFGILRLLIDQVDVLETMTPMDFLEFRHHLVPASGFQSAQFRRIEVRLGLTRKERQAGQGQTFDTALTPRERDAVAADEERPSLRGQLDTWLARTPFLADQDFAFHQAYARALDDMLAEETALLEGNDDLGPQDKQRQRDSLASSRRTLGAIVEESGEGPGEGWALSRRALQAALFINLYRDEPILQVPFKLLSTLMDIDDALATWRHRHAMMAGRMIGHRIGTGGSAGQAYLRRTAEDHRVFGDLFAVATFLIPRSRRPTLPEAVRAGMHYAYRARGVAEEGSHET